MTQNKEVAVRVFDGSDGESTLLVGHEAHAVLFGGGVSAMLEEMGYTTRSVANRAVAEKRLHRGHPGKTPINFPEKTTAWDSRNGEPQPTHMAQAALEIRPPLANEHIPQLAAKLAELLHQTGNGLFMADDRNYKDLQMLYSDNEIYRRSARR